MYTKIHCLSREAEPHTHTFNGPLSGTTRVSRYQKGETNLDFTEARDSEWQWHQVGHMQVCTSLQTDNHTSTPQLSFFTGRMPFLPPNQQCQSTEGAREAEPVHPYLHFCRTASIFRCDVYVKLLLLFSNICVVF